MPKKPAIPWQNRIVGHDEMPLDALKSNPRNWRTHPETQRKALAGVLGEVGLVQGVIWNRRTGVLVDGHARVEEAARAGMATLPVTVVDLSPEEEALVLATLDPLAAMAGADAAALDALPRDVATEDAAVMAMLSALAEQAGALPLDEGATGERENSYTVATPSPVYTPMGERPAVADLMDTARRDTLLEAIAAADVPDEVRAFVTVAASRHVVFNYRAIAEFYAHAEAGTQRLMEDSALVIIDFDRAIELGYVRLSERLAEILDDAREDDDDD